MKKNIKSIDSFYKQNNTIEYTDWKLTKINQKNKVESILFSKYGQIKNFETKTLHFHFIKSDFKVDFRNIDSICFAKNNKKQRFSYRSAISLNQYYLIRERYIDWKNYLFDLVKGSVQGVSLVRMWNVSLIGALIFGMFIMTFIYRYLGQSASAISNSNNTIEIAKIEIPKEKKLEEKIDKDKEGIVEDYVTRIMTSYQKERDTSKKQEAMEDEIKKITKGYPIEKMAPYIAKQDKIVAAFLVAIAKKESNWGKRVPVLNGNDCYNYWGYRGIREKMGTGGHTCFDSREDAVKTVAKRIKFLVTDEKLNTPEKLVVWKCGYDCSWDNPSAVRKWITDVDQYFSKFDVKEN